MNLKINSTSIFYILLHFNAGFDIEGLSPSIHKLNLMKSYIQLLNVCLFVIFHHVHSASVAILLDTCELQALFTKTGNLNVFY